MRILVVEDSDTLRETIATGLRNECYCVDTAADGEAGRSLALVNDYDVIVLDLMLPHVDGMSILRELRGLGGRPSPVLILSARDTVADRVAGLQAGADDYLTKPFAFAELLARLQALARRRYQRDQSVIEIAGLTIDTNARVVRSRETPLPLPPREYALLEYLVLRRGELVTRTDIEQHIYDERVEPSSNVVDAAVCSLRRRLNDAGLPDLIVTQRGRGYIIV